MGIEGKRDFTSTVVSKTLRFMAVAGLVVAPLAAAGALVIHGTGGESNIAYADNPPKDPRDKGSEDPCEETGNCGQGDHGKGNPGNPGQGSEHANCNAEQGEVDPNCVHPHKNLL